MAADYLVNQTSVLEDEFTWTKSEGVITRLKRILWALEALRIFRDTLTGCLEKIQEARSEMLAQIHQVRVSRPSVLPSSRPSQLTNLEGPGTKTRRSGADVAVVH